MEVKTRAQRYAEKRNTVASEIDAALNPTAEVPATRMARRAELRANEKTYESVSELSQAIPTLRTRNRSISFNLDDTPTPTTTEAPVPVVSEPVVDDSLENLFTETMADLGLDQPATPEVEQSVEEVVKESVLTPITADDIFNDSFSLDDIFTPAQPVEIPEVQTPVVEEKVEDVVAEAPVEAVEEVVQDVVEAVKEPVEEETVVEDTIVEDTPVEEPVEAVAEETPVEDVPEGDIEEDVVPSVDETEASPIEVVNVADDIEEDVDIDSDDFLNQLLEEVKAYSVANGERSIMDTTATIISDLKNQSTINEQEEIVEDVHQLGDVDDLLDLNEVQNAEEAPVEETPADDLYTQVAALMEDKKEEDAVQEAEVDVPSEEFFDTPVMDDVKEAVEEEPVKAESIEQGSIDFARGEEGDEAIQQLTQKLNKERIFREELLQETRQMKLQMDQYEADMNSLNKREDRTSRVLNFVLVVLILALFAVLGFVAYWAMVDRGVLPQTGMTLEELPTVAAMWGLML